MKLPITVYVVVTTLLLVTLTVGVAMGLPFNWAFLLTCIGQILLVLMVFRVLKDDYATDKTFDDFYEDRPIRQDNYR